MTANNGGPRPQKYEPFPFPVARWQDYVPTAFWPLPEGQDRIARRDVFAVATRWRSGDVDPRTLLVATMLWGYATVGYGPWRTGEMLASDPDGERLTANLAPLRHERPTDADLHAAYRGFAEGAPLAWLKHSFFTKLLYFAGYRRGVGGIQPLILDRLVASVLPAEAGAARGRGGLWTYAEWRAYLAWAADSAGGGEPDAVEMELFQVARGQDNPSGDAIDRAAERLLSAFTPGIAWASADDGTRERYRHLVREVLAAVDDGTRDRYRELVRDAVAAVDD